MIQNIEIKQKIMLVLAYFLMASFIILGKYFFKSIDDLKIVSHAILLGYIIVCVLSLIVGTSIIASVGEGVFSFGLTGGMGHKNIVAASLLVGLISIYTYIILGKKRNFDMYLVYIYIKNLLGLNCRKCYCDRPRLRLSSFFWWRPVRVCLGS